MVPCTNALSDTVMTLGAVTVTPDEKSPHPASGTAAAVAATAVAARLAVPRRRRCPLSASHFTRQSLGPAAGCGSRYGAASPRCEDQKEDSERTRLTLAAPIPRTAAQHVIREALGPWPDTQSGERARYH